MSDTGATDTGSTTDKDAEIEKWKALARKHEKAAKENADAADRLAKLEADQLTKEEQATAKAAAAEKERDEAKADALRWRVAAKHGISDEDAELFLLGTDEATLVKQAERLAGRQSEQRKNGNTVPKEGTNTTPPKGDEIAEFTKNLFSTAQQA